MADTKILVFGDLHLKKRINKNFNVENDTINEFRKVIYEYKGKVENIILCGDTFDPVVPDIMDEYQQIIEDTGFKVHAITGQHDRTEFSWFDVHGIYAEDINEKVVEIEGFKFYGLQYRSQYLIRQALENVPEEADFLVLHQAVNSLAPPHAGDLDAHWLPKNLKGVLVGDLHYAEDFDIPGDSKGYYTGTLVPLRKNEVGNPHGYLTIDSDGKVEKVYTKPERKFYVFKVESESGMDALDGLAHNPNFPSFIYLDYNPELPGIYDKMKQLKQQGSIINAKPLSNYIDIDGEEEIEFRPSDSIKEVITQEARMKESGILMERLSESPTKGTIETFRNEILT